MASCILYFGYTFIMVLLFFLLTGQSYCRDDVEMIISNCFTGSFGFLACLLFVRKIYSIVKID